VVSFKAFSCLRTFLIVVSKLLGLNLELL